MVRVHQDRYQEYIEFDQESRFALPEEVKHDTKHIDLRLNFMMKENSAAGKSQGSLCRCRGSP